MIKPTLKPSARIAARAAAHQPPRPITRVSLDVLSQLAWKAGELARQIEAGENWLQSNIGVDTALLLQHQRGEIGVMRRLLRECATAFESIDDDDSELRSLIARLDEAVHKSLSETLESEKLTRVPHGA